MNKIKMNNSVIDIIVLSGVKHRILSIMDVINVYRLNKSLYTHGSPFGTRSIWFRIFYIYYNKYIDDIPTFGKSIVNSSAEGAGIGIEINYLQLLLIYRITTRYATNISLKHPHAAFSILNIKHMDMITENINIYNIFKTYNEHVNHFELIVLSNFYKIIFNRNTLNYTNIFQKLLYIAMKQGWYLFEFQTKVYLK